MSVERKVVHDKLVDAAQGETSFRTLADGHRDESVVTKRRFVCFQGAYFVFGISRLFGISQCAPVLVTGRLPVLPQ